MHSTQNFRAHSIVRPGLYTTDLQSLHRTGQNPAVTHKGQNYLYMALWDTGTGRLGTLQDPFKVAKEKD